MKTQDKTNNGKAKWQLPKKAGKRGLPTFYLPEGELRERFIKLYPIHFNEKLARLFGTSAKTIQRLARKEGLKKDMKRIKKKHVAAIKRTCEKNGYYASLRGKPVSRACEEGRKRYLEIHPTPLIDMKKSNPRKYRRMMQRRSESWRKTLADERRRVLFGLPQKTKFRVTAKPMTSKATSQKHCMIKRNNYFADEEHPSWVCYDSETTRSPRMEATAVRHGLKVIQADEE